MSESEEKVPLDRYMYVSQEIIDRVLNKRLATLPSEEECENLRINT